MVNNLRIMIYNVEHFSGIGKGYYQFITKFWRYIFPCKEVILELGRLIQELDPDLIFLVEVKKAVVGETFEHINKILKYPHHFFFTKYEHILSNVPIVRGNGCAVFSKHEMINRKKEYFKNGFTKKAFIKFDIQDKTFFVLHLPLGIKTRDEDLHELIKYVEESEKEVVILGDFNTFNGRIETHDLVQKCGLINANALHRKTYPSWNPKREFDYVLLSKKIHVKNFNVCETNLSDHLPLIVEID